MKNIKLIGFKLIIGLFMFSVVSVDAKINPNIKEIYQYDSSTCSKGTEPTCKKISPKTYEIGTIVRYQVNDTEDRYFFVLHDDGETITMQQRGNTVSQIVWNDKQNLEAGPLVAIEELEKATSNWKNVNNQTYELGKTIWRDNPNTGCINTNCVEGVCSIKCSIAAYNMPTRTTKARLISMQEVMETGCKRAIGSCPKWMYNYLNGSTPSTTNDIVRVGNDIGYWTSSVESNYEDVWYIDYFGNATTSGVNAKMGARAVIVVDKEVADTDSGNKVFSNSSSQIVDSPDTLKDVGLLYLIGASILIAGLCILIQIFRKKNHT